MENANLEKKISNEEEIVLGPTFKELLCAYSKILLVPGYMTYVMYESSKDEKQSEIRSAIAFGIITDLSKLLLEGAVAYQVIN